MCWDVGISKKRCVGSGKVYRVSGEVCWREGEEWGSVLGCGAPTHFPISPPSPFLTSPLTYPTHFPTPK